MMDWIKATLLFVAEVIDIIGIIILLYGFTKILWKYVLTEFRAAMNTPISQLQKIRCEIGIYILLALDFLIASDIIHTITDLTQEQLIELTVMILLRTAIGYFLGKEVVEIEAETNKKAE